MVYKNKDKSVEPLVAYIGISTALYFGRYKMALVTDTWGANLNPPVKTFKQYKTLSATAVSGSAVTDTQNIFNKDCPFDVEVLGVEAHVVSASGAAFSGAGASFSVTVQTSDEVDSSPAQPSSPSWDTLVSVNASGKVPNTDKLLFSAPDNVSGVMNASLDKTFSAVPQGGSLRATLSAQAHDAIGVAGSTAVELMLIAECRPTSLKDKRYF